MRSLFRIKWGKRETKRSLHLRLGETQIALKEAQTKNEELESQLSKLKAELKLAASTAAKPTNNAYGKSQVQSSEAGDKLLVTWKQPTGQNEPSQNSGFTSKSQGICSNASANNSLSIRAQKLEEQITVNDTVSALTKLRTLNESNSPEDPSVVSARVEGALLYVKGRRGARIHKDHAPLMRELKQELVNKVSAQSVAVRMFQMDALTLRELELIQSTRSGCPSEAAEQLLSIVTEQLYEVYECFLQSLKETGQTDVYRWLVANGYKDYKPSVAHTHIIREHYVTLVESMETKFSGLVSTLWCLGVIDQTTREEVEVELTSTRRTEKLLSILSRKSVKHFRLFLDALEGTGQGHLVEAIGGRNALESQLVVKPPTTDGPPVSCLHRGINSSTAEKTLLAAGADGSFLIRESQTVSEAYTLCVLFGGTIYRYRLVKNDYGMFKAPVSDEEGENRKAAHTCLFANLHQLVEYYVEVGAQNGLVCALSTPILAEGASALVPKTKNRSTRNECVNWQTSRPAETARPSRDNCSSSDVESISSSSISSSGPTALYTAAKNGRLQTVQRLLDEGVAVDSTTDTDDTSLIIAACKGHVDVVRCLIDSGASVDGEDASGRTALFWAAHYGKTNVARTLVERGAAVDARDNDGISPLYVAARTGHHETFQYLLEIRRQEIQRV